MVQLERGDFDVAHSRVIAHLVNLCDSLNKPECNATHSSNEKEAVMSLLKADSDACQTEGNAPSFDSKEALIERRDYINNFEIFSLQVVVEM